MRYAVIMAGGVGSRLWPMSRRKRPKQLLPLIDGRSLLELAAGRLEGVVDPPRRLICASEALRAPIREAIGELTDEQILGEPVGRDTVNAVGFTAAVLAKRDPDAIFAVLTADHIIEPQDEFRRKVELGFQVVENDRSRFATFSIMPTYPATAYGYVERGPPIPGFQGAYEAKRFVEKPDAKTAQAYLDAGTFGWNSGMFVFGAAEFLDALRRFKPRSYEGIARIAEAWGTPQQRTVLNEVYPTLPKISVDYAVMEPASQDEQISVCTVTMGVWWMDIGSWPSYGETLGEDQHGNRANTITTHLDSRDVLAVSDDPNHTITTIGCKDLIIVHTSEATLVCPASQAERVKELTDRVDKSLQ
ncbi:MAG: mannose-1-phosphate guanylyltransferase [Planctomycetes bacterium]|nr:mannose-1-phosphate guanylyltransferase [Planctomycetota bacterium]